MNTPATNYPYLVGISGGSASGKTRFLHSLRELFSASELCIISQDNYYRSSEHHIYDHNGQVNFDLPECIDYARFIADLQEDNLIVSEDGITAETDMEELGRLLAGSEETVLKLNRYSDMQEFLLLDPIHDVGEKGWPHKD